MAIEDYFKGSSQAYGQLAGSLLAGRRKEDKKEAKRALLASTVMATFGALQNQQKQSIIDGANDVKEQYKDIFTNNKEIYDNPIAVKNRTNYQLYLEDKDSYLHDAAVARFNKDPDLRRELGENPWLSVTRETLPEEDYNNAIKIYNGFITDEESQIKRLGTQPQISTPTFTKFNEAATNEYLAALKAVEDDPRKKGLVAAAWNRIFKTKRDDEGELVSTNTTVLDLVKNLSDAKKIRETQERLISTASSPKNREESELTNIVKQNEEINNLNKTFYVNTDIERKTQFTTNTASLKFEKANFRTKVNKEDYTLTLEDIGFAIEYNENIPGFPGLQNIRPSDRADLLSAITKINSKPNSRPLSTEVGLNNSEIRAYALALNQNPEAKINSELKLRKTQQELIETVNVDPLDVTKIYKDKILKNRIESSIKAYVSDTNLPFDYEGNTSQQVKDTFTYHVIEGALQLQQINKNLSFEDSLLQAIPIQMTGIYKYKDKGIFPVRENKADIFETEFVDMEVIDFMENKTLENARDAKTAVEYLNNKKYIQNRVINKETGETLVPLQGSEFTQDGFKFFTVNVGTEAAPQYVWTYEILPNLNY